MISKIVKVRDLKDDSSIKEDLLYWLSKPPEERVAAVDYLRRQYHGNIQPDFSHLLKLFNAHNVDYLIVGGYALAFHGAPRYTGDIDLFVKPDKINARNIIEALKKFGFKPEGFSLSDFSKPEKVNFANASLDSIQNDRINGSSRWG